MHIFLFIFKNDVSRDIVNKQFKLKLILKKSLINIFFFCSRSLRSFYQIEYLPKLIIIKPDFEVLSVTGRKDLNERGASIAFTNWAYLWNKSKLVIDKK